MSVIRSGKPGQMKSAIRAKTGPLQAARLHSRDERVRKSGFVLPLTMFLVTFMFLAGSMYLFFSRHSKNIFTIMSRDDLAMLVAESAESEVRAQCLTENIEIFYQRHPDFKNLLIEPNAGAVEIGGIDFQMTKSLFGSAVEKIEGRLSLKDVDRDIHEVLSPIPSMPGASQGEYQGTLRLEIMIHLSFKGKRSSSRFFFERDIRRVCIRSSPTSRNSGKYVSSVTNDYLLYVRDAKREFAATQGANFNPKNPNVTINRKEKGKFFFGTLSRGNKSESAPESQEYVFANITPSLNTSGNFMPKSPPLPYCIADWEMIRKVPGQEAGLNEMVDKIKKKISNESGGQAKLTISNWESVKLCVSVIHGVVSETIPASVPASVQTSSMEYMKDYFSQNSKTPEGNLNGPLDFWSKPGGVDLEIADVLESARPGKGVRQRFLQYSTMYYDLSQLEFSFNVPVPEDKIKELKMKLNEMAREQERALRFAPLENVEPYDPTSLSCDLGGIIKKYQQEHGVLLMTMPNTLFPFKPGLGELSFAGAQTDGNDFPMVIPGLRGMGAEVKFDQYYPFASYRLRGRSFPRNVDFWKSNMVSMDANGKFVVHLNGITGIGETLSIPPDTTYDGSGILVSEGSIVIQGGFKRRNSGGPDLCILYTPFGGEIKAQGRVEASLIAIHGGFPSRVSGVNFCGQPANVLGNLVVDRLNLHTMAQSGNAIVYDERLNGDNLFIICIGGRMRSLTSLYGI